MRGRFPAAGDVAAAGGVAGLCPRVRRPAGRHALRRRPGRVLRGRMVGRRRPHLAHRPAAAGARRRRSRDGRRRSDDGAVGRGRPRPVGRAAGPGPDPLPRRPRRCRGRHHRDLGAARGWLDAPRGVEHRPVLGRDRGRRGASSTRAGPDVPAATALVLVACGGGRQQRAVVRSGPRRATSSRAARSLFHAALTAGLYMLMWPGAVHMGLVFPEPAPIVRRRPRLVPGVPYVVALRRLRGWRSVVTRLDEPDHARLDRHLAAHPAPRRRPVPARLARPHARRLPARRPTRSSGPAVAGRRSAPRRASCSASSCSSCRSCCSGTRSCPTAGSGSSRCPCRSASRIGILRDRLFDIDVVVNRTLVYGGLTLGVIASYVVAAALLGTLVGPEHGYGVSLLATGAGRAPRAAAARRAAALGQPAHVRRAPGAAARDPAPRASASSSPPSPTARSRRSSRPCPTRSGCPFVAPRGGRRATASSWRGRARRSSRPQVVVRAARQRRRDASDGSCSACGPARRASGPTRRRLLEDLGRQAGTAIRAMRLRDDLVRSRERLVLAREEERRRLRHDLHDGLGPSLAAIGMRAEASAAVARGRSRGGPAPARRPGRGRPRGAGRRPAARRRAAATGARRGGPRSRRSTSRRGGSRAARAGRTADLRRRLAVAAARPAGGGRGRRLPDRRRGA